MNADADYARVIEQISKVHLTPYVAYVAEDTVDGFRASATRERIVIRVADGKVISGRMHSTVMTDDGQIESMNPVSRPIFDPACYRATGEQSTTVAGAPAIAFTLANTCPDKHPGDHNHPFTTLYAQPGTLRPLDVSGTITDNDSRYVSVSMDESFAEFGGRVMPSSMKVDVSGSGLMFWLQVHVHETYSDYEFMNSPSP
jgi:hypothetical protein